MLSTLGIKLEETTLQRLKSVAQSLDRPHHWIVKAALMVYLAREEVALREKRKNDARWARFQETGQAIPQEQVMPWLDAMSEGRQEPCPA